MGSVQIEYKQYQQIGGNIYCEIQKIHQDPKTLFSIYVCLVIKENEIIWAGISLSIGLRILCTDSSIPIKYELRNFLC